MIGVVSFNNRMRYCGLEFRYLQYAFRRNDAWTFCCVIIIFLNQKDVKWTLRFIY